MQAPLGSSSLPVTGALAPMNDLRVPQPKTLSGKLPSSMAATYQNQQLGGLLTHTSGVVGGAAGAPVSGSFSSMNTQTSQQNGAQDLSGSIHSSNQNLMKIAQAGAARRAALQRVAAQQSQQAPSSSFSFGGGQPQAAVPQGGHYTFQGYSGGATLGRLIPLLGRGYQITDTHRDPAYNRSVGGVPNSYHLDANNPAVDIAGSTAALDALYARLKAMGGWRQLLWRVPGHYDHIHVA